MSEPSTATADRRSEFLAFYDAALPQVYGYLAARCGGQAVAEDLTAETFLAAVDAVRRDADAPVSIPWAIGVARHKLIDHWRQQGREDRKLAAVAEATPVADDPWDAELDVVVAHQILEQIAPHHRAALTLRYLDDLAVPDVAAVLGRTLHATEALLVRARSAFRRAYDEAPR